MTQYQHQHQHKHKHQKQKQKQSKPLLSFAKTTTTTSISTPTGGKGRGKNNNKLLLDRARMSIIRILPTIILVVSLIGSLLIGYNAHISMSMSMSSLSLITPLLDDDEMANNKNNNNNNRQRRPRPRIGAYYYAWYEPNQWEQWKTKYTPILGLYNSTNATVLSEHSYWAKQQGNIDFFIMSWSTQQEHITIQQQYMKHPDTIPIALHIESQILYLQSRVNQTPPENGTINFDEPCINIYNNKQQQQNPSETEAVATTITTTFGETFIAYMIKIMNEIVLRFRHKYVFVGQQQQQQFNNNDNPRPVFVIYLAREFINYEPYIIRLRKYFQTRFGVQPYLIADMVWFERDKKVKQKMKQSILQSNNNNNDNYDKIWDSITGYNRYEGRRDESIDEYIQRTEKEYHVYANPFDYHDHWYDSIFSLFQKATKQQQQQQQIPVPVVPYVQPGYDDLLIRSDQHGKGIERPAYDRSNGQTYHKFWDLAERLLNTNPCSTTTTTTTPTTTMKADEWFIFITSFNEWHESTAIEPSIEWGDQYLQITKQRSKTLPPFCTGR